MEVVDFSKHQDRKEHKIWDTLDQKEKDHLDLVLYMDHNLKKRTSAKLDLIIAAGL